MEESLIITFLTTINLKKLATLDNRSRRNNMNSSRLGATSAHGASPRKRNNRNHSRFHRPHDHFPQLLRPCFGRGGRFKLVALKENQSPPRPFSPIAQRARRHGGATAAAPQLILRKSSPAAAALFLCPNLDLIKRLVAISSSAKTQCAAF
ncbi:unnamed protein product [Cuscuta epithymum]|uniref:Uncharacterized protein n=1 Tax=Cuscuta epithymum TaxID=186058 RepID=A0AAV0FDC3_9ASTE|nr:unnamed protein product [Cuscuta epithymum]